MFFSFSLGFLVHVNASRHCQSGVICSPRSVLSAFTQQNVEAQSFTSRQTRVRQLELTRQLEGVLGQAAEIIRTHGAALTSEDTAYVSFEC